MTRHSLVAGGAWLDDIRHADGEWFIESRSMTGVVYVSAERGARVVG